MKFDDINKIYFLHLSDRYDREEWIYNQIEKMDYFDYNYNIWWTCRRLFFNNENNAFSKIGHINSNPNVISNVINCALEHYTIIRTSYERGFNHILIFEDDVKFNINLEMFKKCIEKIPDNYCCVKFINDVWKNNKFYNKMNTITFPEITEDNIQNNDLYTKYNGNDFEKKHLCCTGAYLLDRNGMEQIINIYHNFNGALGADWVFKYLDYLYISNYNLIELQNYIYSNDNLISDLMNINTDKIFNKFIQNNNQNYIKIST